MQQRGLAGLPWSPEEERLPARSGEREGPVKHRLWIIMIIESGNSALRPESPGQRVEQRAGRDEGGRVESLLEAGMDRRQQIVRAGRVAAVHPETREADGSPELQREAPASAGGPARGGQAGCRGGLALAQAERLAGDPMQLGFEGTRAGLL